jgi:hypothetical protein
LNSVELFDSFDTVAENAIKNFSSEDAFTLEKVEVL